MGMDTTALDALRHTRVLAVETATAGGMWTLLLRMRGGKRPMVAAPTVVGVAVRERKHGGYRRARRRRGCRLCTSNKETS